MADVAKLTIKVSAENLDKVIKGLKDMEVNGNKAVKSIKQLGDASKVSNDKLLRMASLFKTVGRDLSRYLTFPITGAATAATKFAYDFNKAMGNVQALIPNTGNRIYELAEDVKKLGIETGTAFGDIADGLYRTISVFQDSADTAENLAVAVKAGVAGYASTEEAVQLLSAVTRAYGDTSAQAVNKVANLAFETIRLGDTTFPALAAAMQVATDRAERLNISQEDLFTTFATLTGITGDAAMVATQFRSAMDSILTPTDAMIQLFKEMNVESGEQLLAQYGYIESLKLINEFAEKAGYSLQELISRKEGVTLVSRLGTTQFDDFGRKLNDVTNNMDAFVDAYDSVRHGIAESAFDLQSAKLELQSTAVEIGTNLIPMLVELLKFVNFHTSGWRNLTDEQMQNRIEILGLIAAIGPLMIALGSLLKIMRLIRDVKLVAGFSSLVKMFSGGSGLIALFSNLTTVMLPIAGALGGVALAMKLLAGDSEAANTEIKNLIKSTKELQEIQAKGAPKSMSRYPDIQKYPNLPGVDFITSSAGLAVKIDKDRLALTEEAKMLPKMIMSIKEGEEIVARYKKLRLSIYADQDILAAELEQKQGVRDSFWGFGNVFANLNPGFVKSEEDAQNALRYLKDYGYLISEIIGEYEGQVQTLEMATDKSGVSLGGGGGTPEADARSQLRTWQEWFSSITGIMEEELTTQVASLDVFFDKLDREESYKEFLDELNGNTHDVEKELQTRLATLVNAHKAFNGIAEETIEGGRGSLFGVNKEFQDNLAMEIKDTYVLLGAEKERLATMKMTMATFMEQQERMNALAEAEQDRTDSFNEYMNEIGKIQKGTGSYGMMSEVERMNAGIATGTEFLDWFIDNYPEATAESVQFIIDRIQAVKDELSDIERLNAIMAELESQWIANEQARNAAIAGRAAAQDAIDKQSKAFLDDILDLRASRGEYVFITNDLEKLNMEYSKWAEKLKSTDISDSFNISVILNKLTELEGKIKDAELEKALRLIKEEFEDLGMQLLESGLETFFTSLGASLADSANGFDTLKESMARWAVDAISQIGKLMMLRGLELMIPAPEIGIPLFAGGAALLGIGGFLNQTMKGETGKPNGVVQEFASGGVLNGPTYFPMNGGTGLAGEAGPEGVLPLTRTASGNLGVETAGSVNVNVYNNSSNEVSVQQSTDGRSIDVIIEAKVNQGFMTGKFDGTMSRLYGARRVGAR